MMSHKVKPWDVACVSLDFLHLISSFLCTYLKSTLNQE
jgi:hypothetical protein